MGLIIRPHGVKTQFFHFLALQLLTSNWISLGFTVLSGKMGLTRTDCAGLCRHLVQSSTDGGCTTNVKSALILFSSVPWQAFICLTESPYVVIKYLGPEPDCLCSNLYTTQVYPTFLLCDFGQVSSPLCALISSSANEANNRTYFIGWA